MGRIARNVYAGGVAAIAAFALILSSASSAQPNAGYEARIEALVDSMTLEEKAGQLTQFSNLGDVTGPAPNDDVQRQKIALVRAGLVGSMLNVVGTSEVRAMQRIAVEESRLGIPMVFAFDVIHGHKTAFPIPLAEAASWDIALMEQTARVAAIEASAQGLNWTFAPMVDISRDARWGRVMEGAGEDPFLGAAIAVARVRGFQGDDLSAPDTIAATLKHFAGYGFTEDGKDYNTVDVGSITLYNTILPPFYAALEQANARTVMNAFNTLNGVPATGDFYLQRELLKGDWGFDGLVVSDWGSAREMIAHGFARDETDAARLAMLAGSDMDMESFVYAPHLPELVRSGAVPEAFVDDAVRRVLRIKFELGLFDDPYRYIDPAREAQLLGAPAHRELALRMAERSIVLLKNDRTILPLQHNERIALIGALANDKDSPLGNWRAAADPNSAVSVVEAFQQAGLNFTYAQGALVQVGDAGFAEEVVVNQDDRSGFTEAVDTARRADKVVLVIGEDAMQSGEGRSRTSLDLPGVQQDLLEEVYAANQNVVLVVMSGRPLAINWAAEHVPAIVQAWHLGQESGAAITNVLTGRYNPSGKLPMTVPRTVGQTPIYYNHLNTGRPGPLNEVFWSHYIDESNAPLFPFGYGLSFAQFEYSDLTIQRRGEQFRIAVHVTNISDRDGEEVVQLYLRDRTATISRPVRELKGFEKIHLRAGERRRVTFDLGPQHLGFFNQTGVFVVEPGWFDAYVGGSSLADLHVEFELLAQ